MLLLGKRTRRTQVLAGKIIIAQAETPAARQTGAKAQTILVLAGRRTARRQTVKIALVTPEGQVGAQTRMQRKVQRAAVPGRVLVAPGIVRAGPARRQGVAQRLARVIGQTQPPGIVTALPGLPAIAESQLGLQPALAQGQAAFQAEQIVPVRAQALPLLIVHTQGVQAQARVLVKRIGQPAAAILAFLQLPAVFDMVEAGAEWLFWRMQGQLEAASVASLAGQF